MSKKANAFIAAFFCVVAVLLIGTWLGWFSDEPTYHGKTVTQWLDTMVMAERQSNAQGVTATPQTPAQLTNQPGYRAVMSMGAKAVPVLVQRIMDLPDEEFGLTPFARWKKHWQERLNHFRTGRKPVRTSLTYPVPQRDRKTAAGFFLVALGTNAQGGYMRVAEAYAAAPKPRVTGPILGMYPSSIAWAAALPERREELLAALTAGMLHTNGECRRVAASAARAFPKEAPRWKPLFVQLLKDSDQYAPLEALFALQAITPDDELMRTVEDLTQDEQRTEQVRDYARSTLRAWDRARTNAVAPR